MQRQGELLQPRAHDLQEASGLGLVLESDDEIVGIAHDDHVARGLTPSPALGPEIEDVVQVDVGKKRRCHRPLPGPLVTNRHDSVFKDARPEPLLDQADNARIADPVLHEADQPVLTDLIEEAADISIQYPVHLRAADSDDERVQCIMWAAARSKTVREPEEILLIDRV